MRDKKVKLGRAYKRASRRDLFPDYIIPIHEVYRPEGSVYTKRFKYYDLSYGFVAASSITEYDLLTFFKLVQQEDWE